MTTKERAAKIIIATLSQWSGRPASEMAQHILDALSDERIVPHRLAGSHEMWTRLHAHARYLGDIVGGGHDYWMDKATEHAFALHMWPYRIITAKVTLPDGQTMTVDVPVRDSSRNATNPQLLEAYSVITDEAERRGVVLPEDHHEQIRSGP